MFRCSCVRCGGEGREGEGEREREGRVHCRIDKHRDGSKETLGSLHTVATSQEPQHTSYLRFSAGAKETHFGQSTLSIVIITSLLHLS